MHFPKTNLSPFVVSARIFQSYLCLIFPIFLYCFIYLLFIYVNIYADI
jgi:hypothetical protein